MAQLLKYSASGLIALLVLSSSAHAAFYGNPQGRGGSGISNINLNDGVTFQTTLTGMM